MKILFTGGGTGGHIMPIIAIARELKNLYPESKLYYIGPKDKFSYDLLSQEGFKSYSILAGKVRRYFSFYNIIDLFFKIPLSFLQSFFLLLFIRPKLVFSKGGTGSLPVTFGSRILKIPVFIHESDVAPGLSNRITSKWAKKIFTSFEKTEYFNPAKTILVGNPVRKELLEGSREEGKEILNLTFEKPVILILGGSQGSETINNFILLILNNLLLNYEVIHVAGSNNYKRIKIGSEALLNKNLAKYYNLYEFLNQVQLKNTYFACDLVVSRSGSGSIFEIAAIGKPSILIPLPSSAGNHQSKNAHQYLNAGATVVIEQEDLSPGFFLGEVENILSKSEKMKKAALSFAKPKAAEMIAKEILEKLFL